MKRMITRFKYLFVSDVAPVLWELMASAATHPQLLQHKWTLVPIPLHQRRLNWRGFNQSLLIAQGLQKSWGFPINHLLTRRINTLPQKESTGKARKTNLARAFVCAPSESLPQSVLLVDDVATTCSTLQECGKVLKQAGVCEVWGLTLAQTIPK